jgi:hypothetical protein
MMTPEQNNHGLITTGSSALVRKMDQRLDLVSRLIQEIKEKKEENEILESSEEWIEPDEIVVELEKNGVLWGTVEKIGGKTLIRNQKDGFVSCMLHIVAVAALDNLNNSEKRIFNKWAGLPNHRWDQLHYSEFSFSFVKWLSVPNPWLHQSQALSKTQRWLAESDDVSWETNEFSDAITDIFKELSKEIPI